MDDPRATIRPEDLDDEPPARALPATETLQLGELLGAGSMGTVVAAWQPALRRSVAVKRAQEGSGAAVARHLQQEARATGYLEHPNIVPVHDLREGPEGPWLVMKQITGALWSDLIADPRRCEPYLEGRDPLEFHVQVLMAVCRALRFAHVRGVLHRDVKPSNVMIGRFGEVYLLDWGLAVGLTSDPSLPLASAQRQIAGSPAFMAPEMAVGDGRLFSERTDVFLVGATLHAALSGRPLHDASSVQQALAAARDWTADQLALTTPPELASLIRWCTAADPYDRPATVQEVRDALSLFLRRRGSARILADAKERCDRHHHLVETAFQGLDKPEFIRPLATEARFGLQLCLRDWPDDAQAASTLEGLLVDMARYELHRENADAAESLLGALDSPPPGLVRALATLQGTLETQRAAGDELARRIRDEDAGLFAGRRVWLGTILAFIAVGLLGIAQWFELRYRPFRYSELFAMNSAFTLSALTLCWVLTRGAINRMVRAHAMVTATISVALPLQWGLGWAAELPVAHTMASVSLLVGAMLVLSGIVVERRIASCGAPFLTAVPALVIWPEHKWLLFGAANGLSFFLYVAIAAAALTDEERRD